MWCIDCRNQTHYWHHYGKSKELAIRNLLIQVSRNRGSTCPCTLSDCTCPYKFNLLWVASTRLQDWYNEVWRER